VRMYGLISEEGRRLNGRLGVITEYVESTGRYGVRIEGAEKPKYIRSPQEPPGASRSLQKSPEASRRPQEPPGASRSLQELPEAALLPEHAHLVEDHHDAAIDCHMHWLLARDLSSRASA